MRVGLVEDNEDFRAEVAFHLERAGFSIALTSDGRDIDAHLQQTPCDLLVLDLRLPGEDGLAIARRLRKSHPWLGIVMLTARGTLDDRLVGLGEGADAYLAKPVDMRELVVVLHNTGRRLSAKPHDEQPSRPWVLFPSMLRLLSPSGRSVSLTVKELELLKLLGAARGAPVSRQALAKALGYLNPDFDNRRLEVAFSRLRQKIEEVEPGSQVIRAARGQGYLFAGALEVAPD